MGGEADPSRTLEGSPWPDDVWGAMPADAAAPVPSYLGRREAAETLRKELFDVIRAKGYRELPEPVQLASGAWSRHFVDGKRALAAGADLALACQTILTLLDDRGVDFDAVGGLTMGADQFAHGVALLGDRRWFVVRKEPKGRGTAQQLEGTALGSGVRVLLVDDVVSTGGSIKKAYGIVRDLGAEVVFATTLVDRGTTARPFFAGQGVPYEPLFTYADFGMEPVGG